MASTFSPSLKLELIGNGDQSGTWGTTTNTNLGTLLEQAITGVQAITMVNANYTLTDLNGVSDEARNAVLVVGGTNSAIRNIVAPSVNKTYIIANNTVGGFAIIIKTSGGTGLTIPNGATQTVYCDGSEFYAAGFSSSGGAITGNLSVSGTLSVTGATTLTTATATTPTLADNTTKVATTAFVTTAVNAALAVIYPIGCIYTTTVATNPNSVFGFGTWTAFGAGRVLVGDGGGFSAGATGGSADAVIVSHSHSASSSSSVSDPSHTHTGTLGISYGGAHGGSAGFEEGRGNPDWEAGPVGTSATGISVNTSTSVSSSGVSGANANLQPYIVVYMWTRTA